MATSTDTLKNKNATPNNNAMPVSLLKPEKSQGLWADAFKRLLRNRMAVLGLIIIISLIILALFAPVFAPKPYEKQSLKDNNTIPSWMLSVFTSIKPVKDANGEPVTGGYARINNDYILGADYVGRDILSRLIYGTRISLAVAFIGPLISMLLGVTLGCIAGFYRSLDNVIMRIVDLMYGFPALIFIILLMAVFRSSSDQLQQAALACTDVSFDCAMKGLGYQIYQLDNSFGGLLFIFVGIGITSWEGMARLTRGQVLAAREREYVIAAQSIGMGRMSILFRHVLPNIVGPLIISETLTIPGYISTEAFLSFIGLGVNRPTPSWGSMIADGTAGLRSFPNQAVFPALALAIAMFAFNFLGDGLRDALDPRLRGVD